MTMNTNAHKRMQTDVTEHSDLYQALAGNQTDPDPCYPSDDYPRDEWNPVIKYERCTSPANASDQLIHRRYPVLCPHCTASDETEAYGHAESGLIQTSQLITDGHTTVCANTQCDYTQSDPRQIRSSQHTELIGPLKDHSRPRYTHSERVVLTGGLHDAVIDHA